MNITALNGAAARTIGTLQVGESGYIADGKLHDGAVLDDTTVWPSKSDLRYGSFHVTRNEDGLSLVAIRAQDDDELVVAGATAQEFGARVQALQADGWRVDVGSIRVTADGVGGFSYLGLMCREASE